MSPEQARGKAADKRTDIWAFGVILFEMLTGRRAFQGETVTDVLATIIKEDPDLEALPASTPTIVRRLLRGCLTKDPHDRFHDIADARIMLQSGSIDEDHQDDAGATAQSRVGWRSWLPWGLAATFAAVCVAILVWPLRTPSPGSVTKMLVGVEPAEWLGIGEGSESEGETVRMAARAMALSPEGRHLVYSAGDEKGSRLYVRAMDEVRGTPIAGTEGAIGFFLSPDGDWIGFWADGSLKKVRTDGGPAIPICDADWPPYGASWGPFNTIVLGQAQGCILRVSAEGGEPEEITALAEGEISHRHPQLLGDGDTLLFTVRRSETGDWDNTAIFAQSLRTGERKVLVENGADARYAPTGHLVFSRLGTLMAAPFDPKRLEVTGGAVVVLESVRQALNADNTMFDTFIGQFAFSQSGTLVHVPGGVWPDLQLSLVWVDREGRIELESLPSGSYLAPRLSPDGTRVAVSSWGFEGADIWVYELARGTMTRLTFEDSTEYWPIWTPDGTQITFASDRSGVFAPYWIPADGSGPAKRLSTLEGAHPSSWSPDGQVLACVLVDDPVNNDIWMLPLEGEPRPFIESPFAEGWPAFSPDGRWLAYASDQSGQFEVYVTPYPGPGPRVQISNDGGIAPVWSPNGGELFYRGSMGHPPLRSVRAVEIMMEPSFSSGRSRELFKGNFMSSEPVRSYDVTSDGQKFLIVQLGPRPEQPVTQMHVTFNWFEELKRLAPTE